MRSLKFSHSSISQTAKALGDKDRGTITDYLRGISFEYIVQSEFDLDKAASRIAASSDAKVIEQLKGKIENYLNSVKSSSRQAAVKGLPKKYHPALDQIISRLGKKEDQGE